MTEPEPPPPRPGVLREMAAQIRPTLVGTLVLTGLTGVVYPLALGLLGRAAFPRQAGGSLVAVDGVVVGSSLIGQGFTKPGYFHPRPSAAGTGYDGAGSSGTNLGPSNPRLVVGDAKAGFVGARDLADAYRRDNGLAPGAAVPADAVTRSGSGLDPHISPANAALQVARVARERGLGEDAVRRLVADHTRGRQFGLLGAPRVEVLGLNLALDRAGKRTSSGSADGSP